MISNASLEPIEDSYDLKKLICESSLGSIH